MQIGIARPGRILCGALAMLLIAAACGQSEPGDQAAAGESVAEAGAGAPDSVGDAMVSGADAGGDIAADGSGGVAGNRSEDTAEDTSGNTADTADAAETEGNTAGTAGNTAETEGNTADTADTAGNTADAAGNTAEDTSGNTAGTAGTEANTAGNTDGAGLESRVELVSFDDDFATSIEPIIAEKCANCHGAGGPGASHWQISTAQDLVDTHLLIRGVVESGYMPPWPASDASIAFRDNRDLRPDQVAAIVAWSEAGAPLDISADTAVVTSDLVDGLDDPDAVLNPAEPYTGSTSVRDDYRCQIYDPEVTDGAWVTGFDFIPDQAEVVHHAIGYLVPGELRARAAELDGADGKPGWTCYGSSGLGEDEIFVAWAPGLDATVMPDGAGRWLPPDSFLVVQLHYHYETSAPPDSSAVELSYTDAPPPGEPGALDEVIVAPLIAPAEIPCTADETAPLCERDAALAHALDRFGDQGVQAEFINRVCGATPEDFAHFTAGVAESSCDIPAMFVDATGEMIGVLGHMHEIGDWLRITLNPDTPDEVVLLDIPDWDFDWQYNYVPVEPITIAASDRVRIECGWDRSRRPDSESAYILWADGTEDEMCFGTLVIRK